VHAEFPSRPTDPDQCQPSAWHLTPEYRQWSNEYDRIRVQYGSYGKDCDRAYRMPSGPWTDCYNRGMKASGDAIARHKAIGDQATRQYAAAHAQCVAVSLKNPATTK